MAEGGDQEEAPAAATLVVVACVWPRENHSGSRTRSASTNARVSLAAAVSPWLRNGATRSPGRKDPGRRLRAHGRGPVEPTVATTTMSTDPTQGTACAQMDAKHRRSRAASSRTCTTTLNLHRSGGNGSRGAGFMGPRWRLGAGCRGRVVALPGLADGVVEQVPRADAFLSGVPHGLAPGRILEQREIASARAAASPRGASRPSMPRGRSRDCRQRR